MELKEKIGDGMTAETYILNDNEVVKLFFKHIPTEWVDYEFNIATQVSDIYKSTPKALKIVKEYDRSGILYERAYGKELSEILQIEPHRGKEFGKAMASLHSQMHRFSLENLPSQKERYKDEIEHSREILGDKIDPLIFLLDQLDTGYSICHGDFHLGNIMLHEESYKVIDWMNACKGNPLADVNRTLLMLETPYSIENAPSDLKSIVIDLLTMIKNTYLDQYMMETGATLNDIIKWRPIVAAARLKENIPGEKEWLINMI